MCLEGCDEKISRRNFLTAAGAVVLTGALLNKNVPGQQGAGKALADPAVSTSIVNFESDGAVIEGFLARPKKRGKYRAIIVTHGNAALPEDIRNTAAQLALGGLVALAVNPTSRYPDMSKFPRESLKTNEFGTVMMEDIRAGINFLEKQAFVRGKGAGIVGFCGGGIIGLMMAGLSDKIEAVVALYAAPFVQAEQNSLADPRPHLISFVEWIDVPIQAHVGTADPFVPLEDAKKFEAKLRKYNPRGEMYYYKGAAHGFANYTNDTYDAAAAKLAESRMLEFLKRHLT